MNTTPRGSSFAGAIAGSIVLAVFAQAAYALLLPLLALPIVLWARRPRHDLQWAFGLPLAASVGLAVIGGPLAFAQSLLAQPLTVLSAIAFSTWVLSAMTLGLLAGLRSFQRVHAYTLAYRRAHDAAPTLRPGDTHQGHA